MSELVTNAELVAPDAFSRRSAAELHAMAFLARYRVDHTRRSYEIGLRQWFGFCDEHGIDPLQAERAHIEIFARELEATGRRLSTVGTKLNALAGFYKYAKIDGLIPADPMANVARPAIQRTSTTLGLTRTEFADVLKITETCTPREHAILLLLGFNGLRVSEVCGIDIDDLDRFQGQRTIGITRKGGKRQIIPLAPRTAWQVDLTMGDRIDGPLFLDGNGVGRVDRRAIGRIVKRIVTDAGIRKRITPHSFRHTFVTMSLDAGRSERDIAASTGHADTRMVTYYDRGRDSIARNTTNSVAAWVEGAT